MTGEQINHSENASGTSGAEWDNLKTEVPFGGWGSEARQKLGESSRLETTGAYILNDQGEITGMAPNLPQPYELSNMKYEQTIGGELEFLNSYLKDKHNIVEEEGKKLFNGEKYNEQRQRLVAEENYIQSLQEYFKSANEQQRNDQSQGNVVFDKIKDDRARLEAEKKQALAELKELGISNKDATYGDIVSKYDRQIAPLTRVHRVLYEKFMNGGKIERGNVNYGL